ncbi:MAG: YceD family protein [Acutalibacteraceae bacterium]
MIIELESVFNTDGLKIPFDYELSLSGITVSGLAPVTEPVKVSGYVENKAGIVNLKASAALKYEAPCDRCAENVISHFSFPVEHTLVVALESGDNDDFLEVPNMRLNLDELVEEDVNLALPTKYLCNDDCKGLCPICGKNLNKSQCDCKAPIDPRMEALLQLLDE